MRSLHSAATAAGIVVAVALATAATPAHGQNDWQYPDPYFGILEIEKSHDGVTRRKYRGEVSAAARAGRPGAPATVVEPAPAPVASPRPPRTRWKSRWRR